MKLTYAVVIEQTPNNYAAYAPEVPGCISTAKTRDEMLVMIREALTVHIEFLIEDGDPAPEPTMSINDAIAYHSKVLAKVAEGELVEPKDAPATLSTTFCMVEIEVPTQNYMHTATRGFLPEATHTAVLDPSPRFKPSGVEWLGDMPEHWEMYRLKYVAVYRTSSVDKKTKEGELPVRLCNYTDVYYGNRIRVSECEFMWATASSDEVERFRLCNGDVLLTKDSEDWRDIGIPALVDETADDFVCGYHLGIIRTGPLLDADFLYCAMQAGAINQQLQVSAQGVTRFGLPNSAIRSVLLPFPPLDEQRAIAAYLNREMERIDALVAKQRLLIERLEEYRAALITQTVTRGLLQPSAPAPPLNNSIFAQYPSQAPLKPLKVERLGEIPEHWKLTRLKFVVSINDDTLSESEDPLRLIAYVDIGSIDATFGITEMEEMVFEDAPSRARRLVCDGDTIVSTVRTYLRAITPVSAPHLRWWSRPVSQ